jgi:hypothetical protein
MNTQYSRYSGLVAAAVFCAILSVSCGSSGGGNDEVTELEGTLRRAVSASDTDIESPVDPEGVEVCAFGACSTTDGHGHWGMGVPRFEYHGEGIIFTFTGRGLDTTALVDVAQADIGCLTVEFVYDNLGNVEAVQVIVNPTHYGDEVGDQDRDRDRISW